MRTPFIFWSYVARLFIFYFLTTLVVLSGVILMIDSLEILRKSFGNELEIEAILKLTLYKLPYLMQNLLPFAILIGTSFTFSNFNKNNELIVARASGISAWNLILPVIFSSFIIGLILITVINPIVAITLDKQERAEGKYLHDSENVLSISESGIWLKDTLNEKIEKIIYAKSLYDRGKYLSEVSIFIVGDNFSFKTHIEADTAKIENSNLIMNDVLIYTPGELPTKLEKLELPTSLISEQLQESISIPEKISIWQLSSFIEQLENAGFSSISHKLHFYNLLITPFFLSTLVLIAASFSLTAPRKGKIGIMVATSIIIGFIIYFLTKIVYALGLSGSIDLFTATSAPVIICLLIGVSIILHYEDG